jgi:hypothetical protein
MIPPTKYVPRQSSGNRNPDVPFCSVSILQELYNHPVVQTEHNAAAET